MAVALNYSRYVLDLMIDKTYLVKQNIQSVNNSQEKCYIFILFL